MCAKRHRILASFVDLTEKGVTIMSSKKPLVSDMLPLETVTYNKWH